MESLSARPWCVRGAWGEAEGYGATLGRSSMGRVRVGVWDERPDMTRSGPRVPWEKKE
ncbi:hypothetical protein B005_0487 [Nocardiopsis alba ATCC BAA-2165]|uniref:Uncharacterized protein n=1 Tax=Nocardiopsis alba (strain ATCC BAA-2165 / BE74) TaxID=1205910 RepID=J7LFC1_NOCAA|nr:hypothetical protein B005_0487 [Nocardiopsis alba ATCC BAA-2165]